MKFITISFAGVIIVILSLLLLIHQLTLVRADSSSSSASISKRVSPCIWSRQVTNNDFSPKSLSKEFNLLYRDALIFEATSQDQAHNNKHFSPDGLVLSVFFTSKRAKFSFTKSIDTVMNLDGTFKLLPGGFLSEVQKRQDVVKNTCSRKLLQLALEVVIVDDKSNNALQIEKQLAEEHGLKSPILYTVLPSPPQQPSSSSSSSTKDDHHHKDLFVVEDAPTPAAAPSPSRRSLFNFLPDPSSSSSSKMAAAAPAPPPSISEFHFYNAELHPFVVFNFLTGGLQDLALMAAIESSKTMKCVSEQLEKIKSPEQIEKERKEELLRRRTPEEVLFGRGRQDQPFTPLQLADAAEDCIDLAFSKIKKVTTLTSSSRSSSTDRAGAILRTASSMDDIIAARDQIDSPKRVIVVVNDATVVPFLAGLRYQHQQRNDTILETASRASNLILSAASEGRALFVWYRFEERKVDQEIDDLKSKYSARTFDQLVEKAPPAITRVNASLWSHYFRARKIPFDTTPNFYILTDSRIDDGVLPYRGSWELGQSSTSVPEEAQSASSIYRQNHADGHQQQLHQQQSSPSTPTAETILPGENDDGNTKKPISSSSNDKNADDNKLLIEKMKATMMTTSATTSDRKPTVAPTSLSHLLHHSTPFRVVNFIRSFSNPKRALQPIFPQDFHAALTPFRFAAIFLVQTLGYDARYNLEVSKKVFEGVGSAAARRGDQNHDSLYDYYDYTIHGNSGATTTTTTLFEQISTKGIRTGGLLPFRKTLDVFGQDSSRPSDEQQQQSSRYSLVPIVISNAVLLGDVATQLTVSSIVPCFLFYDRRDRRIITDKKLFRMESAGFEHSLITTMGDPKSQTNHAAKLVDHAVGIWRRAERKNSFSSSSSSSSSNNINNNNNNNDRDPDLIEEPTTTAGKIMRYIEEKVPFILGWRLWLRVDPEEMLLCLGAAILSLIVVVVLVFVFYLVKLPESATFRDIISGDKEKEEAARQKVRALARARANLGNPDYKPTAEEQGKILKKNE